jgi:hypothetical protein
MKKIILLATFGALTIFSTPPSQALPTNAKIAAQLVGGVAAGAVALIAGKVAYEFIKEKPSNSHEPSLMTIFTVLPTTLLAATSGILSYLAFNAAYNNIKA